MKKNIPLVFLLTALTVAGLYFSNSQSASAVIFGGDTPGDGFETSDPCGFLMGGSLPYNSMYVDADAVPDANQACADESGYFYEYEAPVLSLSSDRDSHVRVRVGSAVSYTVDLVGSNYGAVVDQTTGQWSGYGYITDASYPGTNRWVWFDWNCVMGDAFSGSGTSCGSGINNQSYRVRTDLDTGLVTGYAWNDDMGFISFRQLTMELPPHEVEVYVDIFASDTELGPNAVDLDTAPLADGYDYWRIRVQFWDATAHQFLDEDDFVAGSLNFTPSLVGDMFLNQIENTGDPVMVSAYNPSVGCTDLASAYCSMTEVVDGSWSANLFIFSGAPTSNMLGINSDSDLDFENLTDREGCRWIYRDQWFEVDHATAQKNCPYPGGTLYNKADVFYERSASRNSIGLEILNMTFTFDSDRSMSVSTTQGTLESAEFAGVTAYYYYPTYNGDYDDDGIEDGIYLSYKPRFTTTRFVSLYDGEEYTQISEDPTKPQSLSAAAVLRTVSDEALDQSVPAKPALSVNYQSEATSSSSSVSVNDQAFIMDTADSGMVPDCGRRSDTLAAGTYGASYSVISPNAYTLGYLQKDAACQGSAPTGSASNTVHSPTVEQWVCDAVSVYRFSAPSCYYTAYLNIVDRHTDPQVMKVMGAISEVLNDETILPNTEEISVLGSTETIKLRNKIYVQIVRYMLGQNASSGTLDSSMEPSSGLRELMNGRLVIAEGDVIVEGSSAFNDKTLVVLGGNVYINGDLTNGRLGVIVLQDEGLGGNVYVAPNVVELYANFFLDGAFYSYDGVSTYEEEPYWVNDEVRIATLLNQLYLNGSLVARNTVNGSFDADGDGYLDRGDGTQVGSASAYTLQDGSLRSGYALAREHDLNLLRQYRLCYPLLSTGMPDTSAQPEECSDGQRLSEYGQENGHYNSFILDYTPPDSLPIFRSQVRY
ncbi:hypothetical protein IPG41_03925 [Candidatus Peregrinibacteria bacterium]|nr:MAG: hypothetical protein IPG41_03925 [Candidatus Peregrinibacteria bacterium]